MSAYILQRSLEPNGFGFVAGGERLFASRSDAASEGQERGAGAAAA